jgi:signal peptidase I
MPSGHSDQPGDVQQRPQPLEDDPPGAHPALEEAGDRSPVSTTPSPDGKAAKKAGGKPPKKRGPLAFLTELPVLLLVAFVLALLIKSFLLQAFYIPSESMEPTLEVGDRVLVNKVVYRLHPPRRGDVVVFADPDPEPAPDRNPVSAFWHWLTEGLGVSTSPEKDFIKRVIGLPGETVEVKRGEVFIDGQRIDEPYLGPIEDDDDYGPVEVPPDSLFVMGDNRPNSNDSRRGLGFIPYDKVIGKAFVVIWPPSRVGGL